MQSSAVVIQAVFVIAGVIAAYYRFRREEPLTSRLQPTISGVAAIRDGTIYLQINLSVENVGQVPVAINTEATVLRVSARQAGQDGWGEPVTLGALDQQEAVRPGATVIDRLWQELPYGGEVALLLELSVAERVENEDSSWLTVGVVNLVAQSNNTGNGEQEG